MDATHSSSCAVVLAIFKSSAAKGFTPAMDQLGRLYEEGQIGLEQDWVEAAKWYREAYEAETSDTAAGHALATLCRKGGHGIERDTAKVALYKLNEVYPQLESAWFNLLSLSGENLVSNFAFSNGSTCTATPRRTLCSSTAPNAGTRKPPRTFASCAGAPCTTRLTRA